MKQEEILLIYDGECPACNAYCQVVNIRESVGDLRLVDARQSSDIMVNYWIFKSKTVSSVFYPILKFCRNSLLKILGKTKINNLNTQGNVKF